MGSGGKLVGGFSKGALVYLTVFDNPFFVLKI